MSESSAPTASPAAHPQARAWLSLALLALLVGGALSLVLIVSRVPGMTRFFDAPLVAKKSLVVHVNLVLTVWFLAFIAALFSLIPGRRERQAPVVVAAFGVALFVASGLVRGAEPILCNYVPVLDQPTFVVGLGVFLVGVLLALADRARLVDAVAPATTLDPAPLLSPASVLGLRVAVGMLVLALAVLASAIACTTRGEDHHAYYETLFWGAGHVLQLVFLAAMLSVWLVLVHDATGECPLARTPLAHLTFALVWLPALPALWLLGKVPTDDGYYSLPTALMRWGTWQAPALVLLLSLGALWRARRRGALRVTSSLSAFVMSVVLLALGITLGVFINRASTLVPAHYHATVGAVTVALMGVATPFLAVLGMPLPTEQLRRLARWQPVIFGVGQLGFVSGFAYAGWHGLGRKVYGHEQALHGIEQTVGLAVMGTGGTVALVGGALFFYLVGRCWRARAAAVS